MVTVTKKPIEAYTVLIELDLEAAEVLLKVVEHVGGSPQGPRRHTDTIHAKLRSIGVNDDSVQTPEGSIYFI